MAPKKPRAPKVTTNWPVYTTEPWPIGDLLPYARNARTHSDKQVAGLAALIQEFGWTMPILADEDGEVIAGHGRILAAHLLGLTEVPVATAKGWTEEQKRAYRIADNRLAEMSSWDEDLLKIEIGELQDLGADLTLTGFDLTSIEKLLAPPQQPIGDADLEEAEGGGEGDGEQRGELLSRMSITIADPKHQPETGAHYLLGGRHHLFVAGVMRDWPVWSGALSEGAIFCPYPGPFALFGSVPEKHPLVMVQPDTYIAGHILDRFAEAFGADSVRKVA